MKLKKLSRLLLSQKLHPFLIFYMNLIDTEFFLKKIKKMKINKKELFNKQIIQKCHSTRKFSLNRIV